MLNENTWHDTVDYSPYLVCLAELSDGKVIEAQFVMGMWETLDGEAIYPVRFMPLRARVLVGLYKPPFEIA